MNELVAVVEDEDDIRALVTAALKKERFRVREHPDGKGFLASLAADRPDLVVLDVMLPDTDGFEICPAHPRGSEPFLDPGHHPDGASGGSRPDPGAGARCG